MKKKPVKIGTIIGDKLFALEQVQLPRHFVHSMHDGKLAHVSVYQARYRVPQDTKPIYNEGLRRGV